MHLSALKKILSFSWHLLGSELRITVDVLAGLFDDIHAAMLSILSEIYPDTATAEGALPGYERVFRCFPAEGDTLDTRRKRVVAAMVSRGGMNRPSFSAVAQALGYSIGSEGEKHLDFNEGAYAAFRADISEADNDAVYDQEGGFSTYTITVIGTGVETDSALHAQFDKLRAGGVSIEYMNE